MPDRLDMLKRRLDAVQEDVNNIAKALYWLCIGLHGVFGVVLGSKTAPVLKEVFEKAERASMEASVGTWIERDGDEDG